VLCSSVQESNIIDGVANSDFIIDSGAGRHMIGASEGSLTRSIIAGDAEDKKQNNFQSIVDLRDNNTSDSKTLHFISPKNESLQSRKRKASALDSLNAQKKCKVTLADGMKVDAVNIGNVKALIPSTVATSKDQKIELDDMLAVPKLQFNLFSVPAANKSGTDVHFWQNGSVSMEKNGLEILRTEPTDLSTRKLKLHLFRNSVRDDPSRYPEEFIALSANVHDQTEFMRWHEALGHPGLKKMQKLLASVCCDSRVKIPSQLRCDACQQSKQTRKIKGSGGTLYSLLEVVHSDICELSAQSLGKARYMLTFTDDFSRYCKIFLLPTKDADTVVNKFEEFVNWAERATGKKVLRLRSDHGSEYENGQMKAFCTNKGIAQEFANVYSPSQNGTAERINRSLLEIMRAIMFQSRLPSEMWGEIMTYSCYLYNYRPHSKINDVTPASKFFDVKDTRRVFNWKYCYPIGCAVNMSVPAARRNKKSAKSHQGMVCGCRHSGTRGAPLDSIYR
jgi:transposase InsO family protein